MEDKNPLIPDFIEKRIMEHRHPSELYDEEEMTFGERAADKVVLNMGSWRFMIIQTIIVVFWVIWNAFVAYKYIKTGVFDPFPFILLNLGFSTQAAYAAPMIIMSQNRAAKKDREHAENAYHHVNEINDKQDKQLKILNEQNATMIQQHEDMLKRIAELQKKE